LRNGRFHPPKCRDKNLKMEANQSLKRQKKLVSRGWGAVQSVCTDRLCPMAGKQPLVAAGRAISSHRPGASPDPLQLAVSPAQVPFFPPCQTFFPSFSPHFWALLVNSSSLATTRLA
jgi:hypothetical protein